ncbi:hypothetical protein HMPREF9336_04203 [Segniliparus rugosus ATCC BAA-974]|uniref:Uncharacterized protein n=1 Tax=Segniliparus rugosus (strain ATCC BAA-974 / DSM 45345 / CCUG 50838 / CIP 108380 / JCM 13579 / CDC 945) TaxID=679197 RepID=U1M1R1_SEGRC|nr:hypothetical protein HMPREF9336_04203 [Segniliparus rugosus ATCC BAA-974]
MRGGSEQAADRSGMDRVEGGAVVLHARQRLARVVCQLLPQHEGVRMRFEPDRPVREEELGGGLRVVVGEDDEREAAQERDGDEGEQPRVHEGDMHDQRLAGGHEPSRPELGPETGLQREVGVHRELRQSRRAGGVGDQRGLVQSERLRRAALRRDGLVEERDGPRVGAAGDEHGFCERENFIAFELARQLRGVGEQHRQIRAQPREARGRDPAQERLDRLAVQLRREQDRGRPCPHDRARRERDVEGVRFVHDRLVPRADAHGPELVGDPRDRVGGLDDRRLAAELRRERQIMVERDSVRRVRGRRPVEESPEVDPPVADALQNHCGLLVVLWRIATAARTRREPAPPRSV